MDPQPITLSEKYRVADAILGKRPRVDIETYRRYVPEFVSKKGEILDIPLQKTGDLKKICEWLEAHASNGAPCGGGGFEIYEGTIHNEDTEGGYELNFTAKPSKDKSALNISVRAGDVGKPFRYHLKFPISSKTIEQITLDGFLHEPARFTKAQQIGRICTNLTGFFNLTKKDDTPEAVEAFFQEKLGKNPTPEEHEAFYRELCSEMQIEAYPDHYTHFLLFTEETEIDQGADAGDENIKLHHFQIWKGKTQVGELTRNTYFGNIDGTLLGKKINGIESPGTIEHKDIEGRFNHFLKSKQGKKLLEKETPQEELEPA